eukprot:8787460-Alexandrium_andersonii.AAC.1
MPDDRGPPDWAHAGFAGEGAELGAVALRALADPERVYRGAEAFYHAEAFMMSRPVEVIDAVVHRAH